MIDTQSINDILSAFAFDGALKEYKLFGSGHINTTYIVTCEEKGKITEYIVQKINTNVFKNPDELMQNLFAVTSFLRKKIRSSGGDPSRETLKYIKTADGKNYLKCENGDCYRAYRFIDRSISYDSIESAEQFGKSGIAFGKFQRYLADFPADTLYETIPNFHNTIYRFENEFIPAVDEDKLDRVRDCAGEIEFIKARKSECSRLEDLIKKGDLPLRVTHNDTKLNNVIFDEDTNEALCVIDLDTVMPGLALYDFGDSIRYGANSCAEDEPDASKVKINLDYFEAYAKGFLSQALTSLNKCEIDNLAFSAKLMTLECAMRFLTDYLNGDVYFKTKYDNHNLIRARAQLALVADMEKRMCEMEDIIKNTV